MTDRNKATTVNEALEVFDAGACCENEYYWSDKEDIKTIRQALERPQVDVEGLKKECASLLSYVIPHSFSENTMLNTISYLNEQGYLSQPVQSNCNDTRKDEVIRDLLEFTKTCKTVPYEQFFDEDLLEDILEKHKDIIDEVK